MSNENSYLVNLYSVLLVDLMLDSLHPDGQHNHDLTAFLFGCPKGLTKYCLHGTMPKCGHCKDANTFQYTNMFGQEYTITKQRIAHHEMDQNALLPILRPSMRNGNSFTEFL